MIYNCFQIEVRLKILSSTKLDSFCKVKKCNNYDKSWFIPIMSYIIIQLNSTDIMIGL